MREKLVKIFPPCERARGVVFGGPEVVIFPPAGRLASRRASDPPPGGAWRDLFPPQVPGRIGFSVGGGFFPVPEGFFCLPAFRLGGGRGFSFFLSFFGVRSFLSLASGRQLEKS